MKVIFTNGVFDILHAGHIRLLKWAKSLGDRLVVGLNSDESVKRLKGDDRPINSQNDRYLILKAIRCVDEVIIFNEDTPYEVIKKVKPSIIVKGSDYKYENVVGRDLADVYLVPHSGHSTTKILKEGALYRKALEEIVNTQGKVCAEFEICNHVACKSSCASWFIADMAIKEADGNDLYKGD